MERTPAWTLRRRNSIDTSAITTKLLLPSNPKSSSFPPSTATSVNFQLVSFKSSESYTSLKDLLPPTISAVNSPSAAASAAASSTAISIRNRLVKQAAWAYLQPASTSPDSSGRPFFRSLWFRFSGDYIASPVSACLGFINRHVIPTITRAFNRLLQAIRVRTHW